MSLGNEFHCHVCNRQVYHEGIDGAHEHLSLHIRNALATLATLTKRQVQEDISDDREDD